MFRYHKQLRSFHAVAKEGGFTAAAAYLNVGQPTVSQQVRDLEERFAVELFYRRGKAVGLTLEGEQLFAVTRSMFGHEEEAIKLLHHLHDHKSGLLRIGAVSPPIAIEFLSNVKQTFPDLMTDLSLSNESDTLADLLDFRTDIGILARVVRDERLYFAPYQSHRIVAIAHRSHRLAKRTNISLRELAGQRLILRERASETRQIVERAASQQGIMFKPVLEIDSREAIFHAVRAGMGVGFVTEIEYIDLRDLRAIPIERGSLRIDYFIACLASRRDRPIISRIFQPT